MNGKCIDIKDLDKEPFGSVVEFRGKLYWYSKGLDGPILTDKNGHWWHIPEFKHNSKAKNIFIADLN